MDETTIENSEQYKQLIKDFEDCRVKHRKLGAGDSEPDWQFQGIMIKALDGEAYPEHMQWDLFWASMSHVLLEKANTELHIAARKVYDNIREISSLTEFIKQECWRY